MSPSFSLSCTKNSLLETTADPIRSRNEQDDHDDARGSLVILNIFIVVMSGNSSPPAPTRPSTVAERMLTSNR